MPNADAVRSEPERQGKQQTVRGIHNGDTN
jgi:hypothetical protein